jgi:L-ascorbate peroxidase
LRTPTNLFFLSSFVDVVVNKQEPLTMVFLWGGLCQSPLAMVVHSLLVTTTTTNNGAGHHTNMLEALVTAQTKVDDLIRTRHCGPLLVRLAWHDAGTYDKSLDKGAASWPAAGGAVASIRFAPEILHGANKGLSNALTLLEAIHEQVPMVSYADLYQMASVRAIALAGGPEIPLQYGRVDVTAAAYCAPEGNLPDGNPGKDGTFGGPGGTASTQDTSAAGHLKKVFYRMGLDNVDIVALSGAHTFGRAYKDRSGEGQAQTKYTDGTFAQPLADGTVTTSYTPGGSSWTPHFLLFDNSYFHITKEQVQVEQQGGAAAIANSDPALLSMATDKAVFIDEAFRPYAEQFRDSQEAFFRAYATAHKKLSELGCQFDPPEGISL